MNGIEKITQQISADAEAEAQAILAAAKAEAQAIAEEYDKRAEQAAADAQEKGRVIAWQREERLGSAADMEARKAELAAKQEMVGKAFDLAIEKLCALPEEAYVELLANLAVKAASTGQEQVILSQKDRARVGKAVVVKANDILAKQAAGTGMLTLSEQTAPIQGGLILADGDVEINCSFESLVRLAKNDMAVEVAKLLFE